MVFAEAVHSDNSDVHESHKQEVETTLTVLEENAIAGWVCGMFRTLWQQL